MAQFAFAVPTHGACTKRARASERKRYKKWRERRVASVSEAERNSRAAATDVHDNKRTAPPLRSPLGAGEQKGGRR